MLPGSLCVHDVPMPDDIRSSQLPLYATSSFFFENIEEGIETFKGNTQQHFYSRYGNPTIEAVAEKIARMETMGSSLKAHGVMTSSGMSAISTLLIGLLKAGDKILTQNDLYGGTTELFNKILQPLGIGIVYTDLLHINKVDELLANDPSIKMVYVESPANPTLRCVDIAALAGTAKKHGRISVADNTFCTPFIQQPLVLGADYVIHSTTKYLNGHGNSIAGVIVGTDAEAMRKKVWQAMKLLGSNCSPFEAWLTNTGMKTLELRLERHCSNAMRIAEYLSQHPGVERVNYPGLPSHPTHDIAKKQMKNFGGMLSFELKGGLKAGIKLMNAVRFCSLAPTLGDVETLILHPASMSHVSIPREIRESVGITDGLIRLSVGIENVEDILADLIIDN